ncbi:MAG: WbqC family protein [Colwellia sp.]|jgi:WbqC-like protein family.
MIISIIQPCFVPWLGYFEQIALADIFVYMDDVQYTKKDWRNNNQLKSQYGVKGISFPVNKAPIGTLIQDMTIATHLDWRSNLFNQLYNWYKNAPYYQEVITLISKVLNTEYTRLCDLNYHLNNAILQYLQINTKIVFSSDIPRNSDNKIDRIAEICTHFDGVTTLFDGKKAQNFLNADSFSAHGVNVQFQDYQHRPYPQLWGEFVPYMSIIDLLMNCGKDAMAYIVTSSIVDTGAKK